MNCKDIKSGSYDCAYNIMLPYLVKDPTEPNKPQHTKWVSVDKCLLPEILQLWEKGIKTSGCCCGHGRLEPFIGVMPEYISQMKELGYETQFNTCRPADEDSFIPKTEFKYGSADKGFNWWGRERGIESVEVE